MISIHILPNISRSKSNQNMKFSEFIEHNRNIFLKNHTQNVLEKVVGDPFIKNTKLSISLDQQSEMFENLLLLYFQVEVYQNILKLRC